MSGAWGERIHPEIVVYCDDGHRRRVVQTYRMNENEDDGQWSPALKLTRRVKAHGGAKRMSGQQTDQALPRRRLIDSEVMTGWRGLGVGYRILEDGTVEESGVTPRGRDSLVCSACELTVPARAERLQVVFTRIWEAGGSDPVGVSRLSLKGLDQVL